MQVKLDDEILFEIDDIMTCLLADEIMDPIEDIKRRLQWVIEHKCDQCFMNLERKWMDILRADPNVPYIPKDKRELVKMIISRKDYLNRKARDEVIEVM